MRDAPPRAKELLVQAKDDGLNIHVVDADGGGEIMAHLIEGCSNRRLNCMHLVITTVPRELPRKIRMASMKSMALPGREKSTLPSGVGDHNYLMPRWLSVQARTYPTFSCASSKSTRARPVTTSLGRHTSQRHSRCTNATGPQTVNEAPQDAVHQGRDHLADISGEIRECARDQKYFQFFNIGEPNLTNSTRGAETRKRKLVTMLNRSAGALPLFHAQCM